jgi:hypothetical protein
VDYLRQYIKTDNSFFITANLMKQIVIDLTQTLLGDDFDAPNRVFSMQDKKDCPDGALGPARIDGVKGVWLEKGVPLTKQHIIYDKVIPLIKEQLRVSSTFKRRDDFLRKAAQVQRGPIYRGRTFVGAPLTSGDTGYI